MVGLAYKLQFPILGFCNFFSAFLPLSVIMVSQNVSNDTPPYRKRRADSTCEPEPDPFAHAYMLARSDSVWGDLSARGEGCSVNRDGDTTERRVVTVQDAQESIPRGILEDKEEGELSDSQISDRVCMEIGMVCCNVSGCTRDTWNGLSDDLCCRTCKASSGKSHGPACEESLNAAIASAKMIASINSKRVPFAPFAPLPSNSLNQGWVCCRDASGNLMGKHSPHRDESRRSKKRNGENKMHQHHKMEKTKLPKRQTSHQ